MDGTGVIIGVDPHKASNTIAVLERDETICSQRRFVNSVEGFDEMVVAVGEFEDRVWAVEGANGMGRNVAQRLVAAGETVIDVPAKLSTRVRVYSIGHGTKTDKTDAVATAKAALHSKHLRFVTPDGVNTALKLLVDRREQLVWTRTQTIARLHRLIRELINAALILGEVDNVGRFPSRNHSPTMPAPLRSRCPRVIIVGIGCRGRGTGGSTGRSTWRPSCRSVTTTRAVTSTAARSLRARPRRKPSGR